MRIHWKCRALEGSIKNKKNSLCTFKIILIFLPIIKYFKYYLSYLKSLTYVLSLYVGSEESSAI